MRGNRPGRTEGIHAPAPTKEREIRNLLKTSPLGMHTPAVAHERSRSFRKPAVPSRLETTPSRERAQATSKPSTEKDYGRYYAKPKIASTSKEVGGQASPRSPRRTSPQPIQQNRYNAVDTRTKSHQVPEYEAHKYKVFDVSEVPTPLRSESQIKSNLIKPLSPVEALMLFGDPTQTQPIEEFPQSGFEFPTLDILTQGDGSHLENYMDTLKVQEQQTGGMVQGFYFSRDPNSRFLTWIQTGGASPTVLFSGEPYLEPNRETFGEGFVENVGFRGFWDVEIGQPAGPGLSWVENSRHVLFAEKYQTEGFSGISEVKAKDSRYICSGQFVNRVPEGVAMLEHVIEFRPEKAILSVFNPLIPSHWQILKDVQKPDYWWLDPLKDDQILAKVKFVGQHVNGMKSGPGLVQLDLLGLHSRKPESTRRTHVGTHNLPRKVHERILVAANFKENGSIQDGYSWVRKDLYVDENHLLTKDFVEPSVGSKSPDELSFLKATNFSEYRGQLKNNLKEGLGYFRINLSEVHNLQVRDSALISQQTAAQGFYAPVGKQLLLPYNSKPEYVKYFGQFVRDHVHGFGVCINEISGEFLVGEFRKGELVGQAVLFQDKHVLIFEGAELSPTGANSRSASRTPHRKKSFMGEDIPLTKPFAAEKEPQPSSKRAILGTNSTKHPIDELSRILSSWKIKIAALAEALGGVCESYYDITEDAPESPKTGSEKFSNWQRLLWQISQVIEEQRINQQKLYQMKELVDQQTTRLKQAKAKYWHQLSKKSGTLQIISPKLEAFYNRKMNVAEVGSGSPFTMSPQQEEVSVHSRLRSPGSQVGANMLQSVDRSFRGSSLRRRDRSGLRKMTATRNLENVQEQLNLPQSPPSHNLGVAAISKDFDLSKLRNSQQPPSDRTQMQILKICQRVGLVADPNNPQHSAAHTLSFSTLARETKLLVEEYESAVDRLNLGCSINQQENLLDSVWLRLAEPLNQQGSGKAYQPKSATKIAVGDELPSRQAVTPTSKYTRPESTYDKVGRIEPGLREEKLVVIEVKEQVSESSNHADVKNQDQPRKSDSVPKLEEENADIEPIAAEKPLKEKRRIEKKSRTGKCISYKKVDSPEFTEEKFEENKTSDKPEELQKVRRNAAQRKKKPDSQIHNDQASPSQLEGPDESAAGVTLQTNKFEAEEHQIEQVKEPEASPTDIAHFDDQVAQRSLQEHELDEIVVEVKQVDKLAGITTEPAIHELTQDLESPAATAEVGAETSNPVEPSIVPEPQQKEPETSQLPEIHGEATQSESPEGDLIQNSTVTKVNQFEVCTQEDIQGSCSKPVTIIADFTSKLVTAAPNEEPKPLPQANALGLMVPRISEVESPLEQVDPGSISLMAEDEVEPLSAATVPADSENPARQSSETGKSFPIFETGKSMPVFETGNSLPVFETVDSEPQTPAADKSLNHIGSESQKSLVSLTVDEERLGPTECSASEVAGPGQLPVAAAEIELPVQTPPVLIADENTVVAAGVVEDSPGPGNTEGPPQGLSDAVEF